jgi:hypothetical protein
LDNEVFDEDEKNSLGDSWMNEIPGLIWTMKVFDEDEENNVRTHG